MAKRRLVALAVVAMISLVATGWISDQSTRAMARSLAALDGTREVLLAVDQLRAALAKIELDARGYAITGKQVLRKDFESGVREVSTAAQRLKVLTARNARGDRNAGALITRRVILLRNLIALRDGNGSQDDLNASVLDGYAESGAIAATLDQIRSEALRDFTARASQAEAAQANAMWAPWLMCFIAIVVFTLMLRQLAATFHADHVARESLRRAIALEHLARERAQETDQIKDQFLATVSHELRTPLTTIIGWCGLLTRTKSDDVIEQGLTQINAAAHVQSELIEDLLDVSRIIGGKLKLCVSDVDVVELLERAIASMMPAAEQKQIAIRRSFGAERPLIVADPTRLQQIVSNLLSNSIKFTPEGGSIDVSLTCSDSEIEIVVRDDGKGIAADLLPHVFDRFRQGDATVAREAGLGLGLSIVKNLVELHGGKVGAQSDGPGKGAAFTVRLPLQAVAVAS